MSDVRKDVNGKDSSKRKFGAILIGVDVIVFLIYFAIVMYLTIFDEAREGPVELITPMLYDMWLWILWMGTSLLGLTVTEHFMSFIKSKKGVS